MLGYYLVHNSDFNISLSNMSEWKSDFYEELLILPSFHPWGPRPRAPLGSTWPIWTTLGLYLLIMIPTKFYWNILIGFGDNNENVFFPLGPPPQKLTPLGAQGGHPSICREQTIFFIYKGIYIQNIIRLYCFWFWRRRFLKFAPF